MTIRRVSFTFDGAGLSRERARAIAVQTLHYVRRDIRPSRAARHGVIRVEAAMPPRATDRAVARVTADAALDRLAHPVAKE